MNAINRQHLNNLRGKDRELRYAAFQYLLKQTDQSVDWAYEAWEELVNLLESKDNHERSIAAQLLSNLAKSDPEGRLFTDLDKIMRITRDEKFVTARHALQSLWKVGVTSDALRTQVIRRLSRCFRECADEKNHTLIRYDIIEVFRKIFDTAPTQSIKIISLKLIETEENPKYRKKYLSLWKDV
ncbi:MAG: hypothetical protein RIF32_04495 [Leptospirales bacterium]